MLDGEGTDDTCNVCGWEDSGFQRDHPDDDLGPNGKWTMNEARKAWKAGKTIFHEYPNPNAKKL